MGVVYSTGQPSVLSGQGKGQGEGSQRPRAMERRGRPKAGVMGHAS